MIIVTSKVWFRAVRDASEYVDRVFDDSREFFEPELLRAKGREGFVVITQARASNQDEAEKIATLLKGYKAFEGEGDLEREPQIEFKLVGAERLAEEEDEELGEEEEEELADDIEEQQELPSDEEELEQPEEEIEIPEEAIRKEESPTQKEWRRKYRTTPKFKASQRKYQQSTAGRSAQRRYAQTLQGQEIRERHASSPKGVASRKANQERQKTEHKFFRMTDQPIEDDGPFQELVSIIETEARDPSLFIGAEAIFALTEATGIKRTDAHKAFQQLRDAGIFVEVRR